MPEEKFAPTIKVSVYGWDFALQKNGAVVSKCDAQNLPWAERRGREMNMADSQLGSLRYIISNAKAIFPENPGVLPSTEPLKEAESRHAAAAV